MPTSNYAQEAAKLSQAIDIALEVLQAFPRKGYQEKHIEMIKESYLLFKELALDTKSRNLRDLMQLKNDFLTYFQESSGEDVEYFWAKVKENQLGYKRENKLIKILKRQRIKCQDEYDFITDVMMPYQQEQLINDEEVRKLSQYLSEFEQSYRKTTTRQK